MKNIYAFYSDEKYKNLNSTAKIVYTLIYNQYTLSLKNAKKGFEDDKGVFCFLAQKKIADMLGKSDRTIRRAFKQLKEAGLINVVELGCKKVAKIYVNVASKKTNAQPIEINNAEVKTTFEEVYGETANNKEAKALNELADKNETKDLVEAINRSKDVKFKSARIKYIKKTLVSVIEEKHKQEFTPNKLPKKIIRKELVPDWLNKEIQTNVDRKYTSEELNKIERMKNLQAQILGNKLFAD